MKKQNFTLWSVLLIVSLFLCGCNTASESEFGEEYNSETESITDVDEDVTESEQIEDVGTEIEDVTESAENEMEESDEADSETDEENITSNNQQVVEKPNDADNQQNVEKPSGSDNQQKEEKPSESGNQQKEEKPSDVQIPSNSEKEPEIYVIDTVVEKESLPVEVYKYGVSKIGTVDRTYEVYNDGTKVCVAEYTSYTYDTSTYNATDNEIQPEGDANCNSYMSYYSEVLNLVNQIRAEAGVGPLTLDTNLCRAANMRALEMDYAEYFEHARADGRNWDTVMDFYGCQRSSWGENIAAGYGSPSSVVEGWKNSSGHYANMINADFTKLGVGYSNAAPYGYSNYWVQLFSN